MAYFGAEVSAYREWAGGSNGHDHVTDVRALLNYLLGVDGSIEGIAGDDRMP